jgi:type IV conjugative transfer system lipoprotein TraV
MNKILGFIFFGVIISGCSDKYSCGQFPRTGCTPVSEVYESTNGGFYDYRKDHKHEEDDSNVSPKYQTRAGGKVRLRRGSNKTVKPSEVIRISNSHRSLNFAAPGEPILTRPVVLRVLYRPWENKAGNLDAGGYMFVRLKESEWLIEN